MNMEFIKKLLDRRIPPIPFEEGDNIPWNEPEFSKRMLAEHLSQEHDLASRKKETIDKHVRWIFEKMLDSRPGRVLDLGCGPGFYTAALAKLGCSCVGIDFSPASIEYARDIASKDRLDCEYVLGDVREALFGEGFDLVMMIFGQINVFRKEEAADIIKRMAGAVGPGGKMLLEPQTMKQVRGETSPTTSWYCAPGGLFSSRPHLVLQEGFFDEESFTRTERFHVLHPSTGDSESFALSTVAYADGELEHLAQESEITGVEKGVSLSGDEEGMGTYVLHGIRR